MKSQSRICLMAEATACGVSLTSASINTRYFPVLAETNCSNAHNLPNHPSGSDLPFKGLISENLDNSFIV